MFPGPEDAVPETQAALWMLLQGTELDVESRELGGPCCPRRPAASRTTQPEASQSHREGVRRTVLAHGVKPSPAARRPWEGSAASSEDPLPAPRPQQQQAEPAAKAARGLTRQAAVMWQG